jgi:methyl-accepting chemotaxis protein
MIDKAVSDHFKQQYLHEILQCKDTRAASALYAYAVFLNKQSLRFDHIPLYLEIFKTNNNYAVDALLSGYVAQAFFDFVKVPNVCFLSAIFDILNRYQRNVLYQPVLKVICGLLKRVYRAGDEGFRLYPTRIDDINNLAKYLNETQSQDANTNRDILDILFFLSEMDQVYQEDEERRQAARQASRIRSDFFDHKRSLCQSMTATILDVGLKPAAIIPEGLYTD